EVIKKVRARVEEKYPGRLLLAEANMWPEDVREYFGDDDECHMAYHFPLMPRMYMAIAQEDRHPVVEILQQTPDIPASCQWAIFLRNHDELTLEMVTSKERDYMYSMYAADSRARINLGIRRRLAPLLENDQDRIKLMNSLLLSMPGTPVLYYGDEIGMGDNIFLGDRDGVRTPMQWTSDRNGGFSRADPQRMYLPTIQDPIYGFEAVNVEAQARESTSLLSWTRRLLAVRGSSQAFGRGAFRMLHPGNRKVLAYVREQDDDVILCVSNLSRVAQPVELDLAHWRGRVPVEMMGRNSFPPIGDRSYLLTLPSYGFFWFKLSTDAEPPKWHTEQLPAEDLPVLVLFDNWNSFFRSKVVPWRMGLAEKTRNLLESDLLPRYVVRQRWYAAKNETPDRVAIVDQAVLQTADQRRDGDWLLAIADNTVGGKKGASRYFLPMVLAYDDDDEDRTRHLAPVAVSRIRQQAKMGVLSDAMADEAFCRMLVQDIGARRVLKTDNGAIHFSPTEAFTEVVGAALEGDTTVHRLTTSSNSVSLLGDTLFLKAYRRLQPGISPELEMGRYLTDKVAYANCVPVAGNIDYHAADGTVWTLAILQAQVTNQGDAWTFAVDQLAQVLEHSAPAADDGESPQDSAGGVVERMQVLARRVGELHVALSHSTGTPAFDPEPVQAADLQRWAMAVRGELDLTMSMLQQRRGDWTEAMDTLATRVLGARDALARRVDQVSGAQPAGLKTRLHGDLHLGQVLIRRDDFLIIDFEGEPQRTLEERRAKHSPLRDVAGMLRSFDYARHTALHHSSPSVVDIDRLAPTARQWEQRVRKGFLDTYREVVAESGLYGSASGFDASSALLDLFELEKALYELRYEIDNRPDWVGVPLAGIAALAADHNT
ncbi:MAG: putative maltokinase, partial [Rubrivivax sp.]